MMKKNQNGITLIALVITIIVLLILAGVSIAMLTGDNGILTKATEAGTNSKTSSADEAVKLAVDTIITEHDGVWPTDLTVETFKSKLKKSNDSFTYEPTLATTDMFTVVVKDGDKTIKTKYVSAKTGRVGDTSAEASATD